MQPLRVALDIKDIIQQGVDDVCEVHPFLTSMVYALKPVLADFVPTMGTDGEFLYYNEDFTRSLSRPEVAGVIYHEVLHCAFLHMWRKGERDHMRWNIACDYAINPTVVQSFPIPKGCLLDKKYSGLSADEIYDKLPKEKKSKNSKGKGKSNKGQSQQQQSSSAGDQKEQEWGDHSLWGEAGKKKKKDIEKARSLIDKATGKNKVPKPTKTESQKEREWKQKYEEAFVDHYGSLPDHIKRLVEQTHYIPALDWSTIVANLLSPDESDYSFSSPDRRFTDADFFLPGLQSIEKLENIVFAYDTSSSITQEMLQAFYHETLNLFDNFSNVKGFIAVCDAKLHEFFELNSEDEFKDHSFTGGGGTDFCPVFKEVEKRGLNPKALFYFTDTEGVFPRTIPEYPVYWLVISRIRPKNYGHGRDVPFGEVIEFLPKGKHGI